MNDERTERQMALRHLEQASAKLFRASYRTHDAETTRRLAYRAEDLSRDLGESLRQDGGNDNTSSLP